MKYIHLKLHGFGRFHSGIPEDKKHFHFSPSGINLVFGRNEQGKSTLMQALINTIYGPDEQALRYKKPWIDPDEFACSLAFDVKGKTYSITRDFNSHKTTISMMEEGKETTIFSGTANPRGKAKSMKFFYRVLEQIGLPHRDVLESLAYMDKLEMKEGIPHKIRQLITGGRLNYELILDKLKEKYFQITMQDPWRAGNKHKPRELELYLEKRDTLKEKLDDILTRRRDYLEALGRKAGLEAKIQVLKEEIKSKADKYSVLGEYIEARKEAEASKQELAKLVRFKDKYSKKEQESATLEIDIRDKYFCFAVAEDLPEICTKIKKLDDKIEEYKKLLKDREDFTTDLIKEIEELKTGIQNDYPDLFDLPSTFPECLEEYKNHISSFQELQNYYTERKYFIEEKEKEVCHLSHLREYPPDFCEKLTDLKEIEKQGEIELKQYRKNLDEIRDLNSYIQEALESLNKNYHKMNELPEDFGDWLKEHISGFNQRKQKKDDLDLLLKEIEKNRLELTQTRNFIPGAISLIAGFLFFIISFSIKSLPQWLSVLSLISGILLSAFLIVSRVKDKYLEKNRLEALREFLKNDISRPIPHQKIVEQVFDGVSPDKYLEKWNDYRKSCKNLEKLEMTRSSLGREEHMTKEIENLEQDFTSRRKALSLPPDEDLNQLLKDLRFFNDTRQKINIETDKLKLKFPSLAKDSPVDQPEELLELNEKILNLQSRYPIIMTIKDFGKIRDRFNGMLVVKGRLNSLESRLQNREDTTAYNDEISKLENERREHLHKIQPIVGIYGENPVVIEREYHEYIVLKDRLNTRIQDLNEFRQEDVEIKIDDLAVKIEINLKKIKNLARENPWLEEPDFEAIHTAGMKQKEIKEKQIRLEDELQAENTELAFCKASIGGYKSPEKTALQIQDELERLDTIINNLELNRDALKLSIDILNESVEKYQRTYRYILEEEITEKFKKLTGKKYNKISMDSNFEITLLSDAGQNIPKEFLSTGTLDQLYFSIRAALIKLLAGPLNPPLLMDDPFGSFDSHRREVASDILRDLSEKHQIFIFSHNPIYREWSDREIELSDDNCSQ